MLKAMSEVESGHDCTASGKSGEYGCFQYMPETWKLFSKEILGQVEEQTEINQKYVTAKKIQKWLNQGMSYEQIALLWNQGHTGPCSKGTNSAGVKYNSCDYKQKIIKALAN